MNIKNLNFIQIGLIVDLLNDQYEYANVDTIKKISKELTTIMNDIAKPIQDEVNKEKSNET